jgi:PHS family inorganic phosphate transporter-like MFS transporter
MMGAVFAMQGIGQFAAAAVALVVTAGFKESLKTAKSAATCSGVCQLAVDKMWRVVIGFGAVPSLLVLYFRLTIPETPRYTFNVGANIPNSAHDANDQTTAVESVPGFQESHHPNVPKAGWKDFWAHYGQWKFGKILIGTAGSWFFLDVGE